MSNWPKEKEKEKVAKEWKNTRVTIDRIQHEQDGVTHNACWWYVLALLLSNSTAWTPWSNLCDVRFIFGNVKQWHRLTRRCTQHCFIWRSTRSVVRALWWNLQSLYLTGCLSVLKIYQTCLPRGKIVSCLTSSGVGDFRVAFGSRRFPSYFQE